LKVKISPLRVWGTRTFKWQEKHPEWEVCVRKGKEGMEPGEKRDFQYCRGKVLIGKVGIRGEKGCFYVKRKKVFSEYSPPLKGMNRGKKKGRIGL